MEGVDVTWNIIGVGYFFGTPESPTDVDGEADAEITSRVRGTSTVRCEVTEDAEISDAATKVWIFAVTGDYDLSINSTEGGSVTTPGEGVFPYDEGTVVVLVAEPDEGYQLGNWTGGVSTIADVEDATTITMHGNYEITANFEEASLPFCGCGCFIATAAYGTPTAAQIDVLREFRDIVLLESTAGSQFVALYYQLSPSVADFISGSSFLRTLVRELLVDPIVWVVEATGDIWRS